MFRERHNQLQNERYWRNRDKRLENNRRAPIRKCGYENSLHQELLIVQHGKCAICGKRNEDERLRDDHSKTNQMRGLLCNYCNVKLGLIDDLEWRKNAEEYLAKYGDFP